MLKRLLIKNFGLIEKAELALSEGMTVFTGETGAGKSMLIDAFSLAIGARGGVGFVKKGAKSATIEATFHLSENHPAMPRLDEMGIDPEDSELSLRRQVMADGKTRCFAQGLHINQGQMAELGALLADIHGQRDQQLLLQPRHHARLLDGFGRLQQESGKVATCYQAWRETADKLSALQDKAQRRDQEIELLTAYVEELNILAPEAGEEAELAEERQTRMQTEKAAASLQEASALLEADSPAALIARAERVLLSAGTELEDVQKLLEELAHAGTIAGEAEASLARVAANATPDEARLEAVDERLHQLRSLARKHNCTCDELPEKCREMQEELERLQNITENMATLENAEQAARQAFETACAALTKKREKAADALSGAVQGELEKLKMPDARFHVRLEALENSAWNASGAEKVAFYVQMNPGAPEAPLEKAASGGEVSRLMLALKVVFFRDIPSQTLVFDEIDTGVGGAVADAMGRCLEKLAENHQVFAITHLPQVAARGRAHMQILKQAADDTSQTNVQQLADDTRLDEIARMLSGEELTASAKQAAASLLEGSRKH